MKLVYAVLFSEGIGWDTGSLIAVANSKDEAFGIARYYACLLLYTEVEREVIDTSGFSLVISMRSGDSVLVKEYKIQTLKSFIKDGRQ